MGRWAEVRLRVRRSNDPLPRVAGRPVGVNVGVLTRLAATMQGRRLGPKGEAVVASDIAGENVEQVDADLDDGATVFTDQVVVMMDTLHEVEDGRAGGELNRSDDAELCEAFECPIDGGLVKSGVIAPDHADDVGCGDVMIATGQHGSHYQPP